MPPTSNSPPRAALSIETSESPSGYLERKSLNRIFLGQKENHYISSDEPGDEMLRISMPRGGFLQLTDIRAAAGTHAPRAITPLHGRDTSARGTEVVLVSTLALSKVSGLSLQPRCEQARLTVCNVGVPWSFQIKLEEAVDCAKPREEIRSAVKGIRFEIRPECIGIALK